MAEVQVLYKGAVMSVVKIFVALFLVAASAALTACSSSVSLEHYEGIQKGASVFIDIKSLDELKGVYVDPFVASGGWGSAFGNRLRLQFVQGGYTIVNEENAADLIARCSYDVGCSLPSSGRNYSIHFTAVRWFNLEFIRRRDSKVVGAIRFSRPLLGFRPSSDYLSELVDDFISPAALELDRYQIRVKPPANPDRR